MDTLPKKLASYIHGTGLRALDHLAEQPEPGDAPEALRTLLALWRTMSAEQKDDFVSRVSVSVGEVIAASALLPTGIKVGKKAVKSAKKVLEKSAKALKKNAKVAKKNEKSAKKTAKTAAKPAKPSQRKSAGASRKRRRAKPAVSSSSKP